MFGWWSVGLGEFVLFLIFKADFKSAVGLDNRRSLPTELFSDHSILRSVAEESCSGAVSAHSGVIDLSVQAVS